MGIEVTAGKETFVSSKSSHAEVAATPHMKKKNIAAMAINEYPCIECMMHLVGFAKAEKKSITMTCTPPATFNYWDGGPSLVFNKHRTTLTKNGPGNCTITFLSTGAIQLDYGTQPALRVAITKYHASAVESKVTA